MYHACNRVGFQHRRAAACVAAASATAGSGEMRPTHEPRLLLLSSATVASKFFFFFFFFFFSGRLGPSRPSVAQHSVNRSKCENDPIMRKMTPFSGTVTHCVLQSKVHSNHWAKAARLPCALDDPARAADRRSRRSTRRSHGCSGPQLANPLESPFVWTWRACRGVPASIICPPSDSSGQMRCCIQVFFGDSCSPKRNNFWHERHGSQLFPTHSCNVGGWISRFPPRPNTACSESALHVPRLADRRQVDHEGRRKGDVDVVTLLN
jgi:hypothetical protein